MPIASRAALPLLLCLAAGTAGAQAIPLPGGTYLQNFDTLSNVAGSTTNSALPAGWMLTESGGGARDNEQYAVDNGGSNTGDTYSYGSAGSTDRALGSLRSGTLIPVFGACFTNTTGGTVNSIDVAYIGEQWRLGTAGRTDTLRFEYSTNTTDLVAGAWNTHAALDFTTPATTTTGAKDGNFADNRTAKASTISGLSIANGTGFCLRWSDLDASGADDGLAIDDFSITVGAASPAPDFSVELTATPGVVAAGGTFEVRRRFTNVGTLGFNGVSGSLNVPAGVTATGFRFENADPGVFAACAHQVPYTCSGIMLPPGTGIDWVQVFTVNPDAVGPLVFEATSVPPAGDSNPANDSDSVTVQLVREAAIHDIQDRGIGSPLLGSRVITEGIVTARRATGYFIQSATADEDADPATAEGLFVFTNSTPPVEAAVGNRVRVSGTVTQFQRSPHGYPLTQLGSSTILSVVATGQPLPPIRTLDASVLSPTAPVDALGRYQGMRVTLPGADVVGPSNSFGDFHIVPARTPRPAREPGVALLDAVPLPQDKDIPRFDRNPERLRVESTGLEGGAALYFDAGTRLPRMDGVLYYDRGDFTLLLSSISAQRPMIPALRVAAVPTPESGTLRIASYNIENLSGGANVPLDRLAKLTEVFCGYLHNPDIVGLVEIANLATAQRLAQAINDDEFGTCPDDPQYEARLLSNSGSQRLGYLIRRAPAPGGDAPRVEVLSIQELFTADTLTDPAGNANGVLFDRPPLHLQARVTGDNGSTFDVDVLLNHTLSLLEVNSETPRAVWGTDGARSRGKRLQQAVRIGGWVEAFQQADPEAPLVLIGDYNAFDFSDGFVDVIGIISGDAAPENEVLEWAPSPVTRALTNLLVTKPEAERYSYVFEGNTQTLDHALVNDAVLESTDATLHHARVNADFAADNAADPTVPLRTSDHDPLVADLVVPTFLDADLAARLPLLPRSATAGRDVAIVLEVANVGPHRALSPELTIRTSVPPQDVRGVNALGWECAAAIADGSGSRIFCGREDAQPAGRADRVVLTLRAGTTALGVEADVSTRSVDTNAANDSVSGSVRVGVAK